MATTYWVKTKDGSGHRADNLKEAYFYLGAKVGRWEATHDQRLEITDWPDEFFENTYCIAYPEGTDPILNATFWITGRA